MCLSNSVTHIGARTSLLWLPEGSTCAHDHANSSFLFYELSVRGCWPYVPG